MIFFRELISMTEYVAIEDNLIKQAITCKSFDFLEYFSFFISF